MLPTSILSKQHFVQHGKLILASHLIKKYFSSGSSLPVVPAKAEESSLVTSVRFPLRGKRRGRRFAFGSGGSSPFSDSSAAFNADKQGLNVDSSNSVNLYSIYGNILAKEPQLLHRFIAGEFAPSLSYPVDPSLTELFRSSARFWYESERIERRVPSLAAVQGPTRNATWEMSQFIATVGRSHLATIPFTLFYELFHQCTSNQAQAPLQNPNSAKKTVASQDFSSILSNSLVLSKNKPLNSKSGLAVAPARNDASSVTSRAVIQVVEYLFACMEASLVDPSLEEDQCTLFLDGLEDFLTSRKGGDVAMRDLITWASLYETSGRKVIIGGRTLSLTENPQIALEEEQSGEDDPSAMSAAPPTSSNNSPLQTLADLFLKGGQEAGPGQHNKQAAESTSPVNVRIEGGVLRLALTAPAADRRLRLAFSQIQSRDRQSDILDANLTQLRSVAHGRWGVAVSLTGLPTRHALPSQQAHLREIFSLAGRGIMLKRRLNRDELNELLVFVLGTRKGQETINEEVIAEALNHTFTLRHDPNRLSSDDLGHLLAERHINPATLTKYERRFVNCIATATTQTFFKDIAVPEQTVSALRALTSLPLSHPELFTNGVLKHSMTGVLLFGPPGTGKTMLARAVAQESGAAFLAVNMSNIFDMWVGEGEKNVKGMFTLARKLAPCIIFIDEIDALLERRSSISGRSSRLEIVNEFMSQWDGLASNLNSGVIVMGATNRPFVLDDAVLRRLPRRLLIDLPTEADRLQILQTLIAENTIEPELADALPELARRCEFYSGSDLKNVAITAGLKAALRCAQDPACKLVLTRKDFDEAVREVPASLSDQMDSLQELRRWNAMYGEAREQWKPKKFGFA